MAVQVLHGGAGRTLRRAPDAHQWRGMVADPRQTKRTGVDVDHPDQPDAALEDPGLCVDCKSERPSAEHGVFRRQYGQRGSDSVGANDKHTVARVCCPRRRATRSPMRHFPLNTLSLVPASPLLQHRRLLDALPHYSPAPRQQHLCSRSGPVPSQVSAISLPP